MMGVGQTGTLQFQSALCLSTGCPSDRDTAEGPRDICSQLTGVLPPKAYNDKTSIVFGPNFKSFHNVACLSTASDSCIFSKKGIYSSMKDISYVQEKCCLVDKP